MVVCFLVYNLQKLIRFEISGIKLKLELDVRRFFLYNTGRPGCRYTRDFNWQVPNQGRSRNLRKMCHFPFAFIQAGNITEH